MSEASQISEIIRAGVVGYGLAGRVFHAPFLTAVPGLELAAIVERTARNAQTLYPNIQTYPSLDQLLEDDSINLIVIATPNQTHAPLAKQALRAGRHVVVDKPTAIHASEIEELIALATTQKRLLIPFHNRRWDGDFKTLRQLLESSSLGRLVHFQSTFDRWRPAPKRDVWREDGSPGGGLLLDLGTHLVDQALQLFGNPHSLGADLARERDHAITEDAFTLRLYYPGLIVELSATALAPQPRPRFSARGTHGSFLKWGLDPQENRLRADPKVIDPNWGTEPESAWGTLTLETNATLRPQKIETQPGDYRAYYAQVRDAILGKTPPPVLATDALKVARILEIARASSASGQILPCNP